jgi:hypothetical protein
VSNCRLHILTKSDFELPFLFGSCRTFYNLSHRDKAVSVAGIEFLKSYYVTGKTAETSEGFFSLLKYLMFWRLQMPFLFNA